MTTSRSRPREVAFDSLRMQRFSPADEEIIIFEVWDGEEGPQLFEIAFTEEGQRSLTIGDGEGKAVSIRLDDFQKSLKKGIEALERWDADLRTDGGPWSGSPYWEREQ